MPIQIHHTPKQRNAIRGLKAAEGRAWQALVDAAGPGISTSREAIETLGEAHSAAVAWRKARAAIESFMTPRAYR